MNFREWLLFSEAGTVAQYLRQPNVYSKQLLGVKTDVIIREAIGQARKFILQSNLKNTPIQERAIKFFAKMYMDYHLVHAYSDPAMQGTNKTLDAAGRVNLEVEMQNETRMKANRAYKLYMDKWGDYLIANANNQQLKSNLNNAAFTAQQLDKANEDWHATLKAKEGGKGPPGRTIIDLGKVLGGQWKKWEWVSLDKAYCRIEGDRAGHCGNANASQGDNIFSLRDPNQAIRLTFIVNNQMLGESKGRGNSKPNPRYHPAIIKLLESDLIHTVKGGGYAPEMNFHFTDLTKDQQQALIKKKPHLNNVFNYIMGSKDKRTKTEGLRDFLNDYNIEIDEKRQEVILQGFEDLEDLYGYIGNGSAKVDNFTKFEDPETFDSWGQGDVDIRDLIRSDTEDKHKEALTKYYGTDDDYDLADAIEEDKHTKIKDIFTRAYYQGLQRGAENEAWKDLKNQLESGDKHGFYVSWNDSETNPQKKWLEIRIKMDHLRNLVNDPNQPFDSDEEAIGDLVDIEFKWSYNGYSDWDKDGFNEFLDEDLTYELENLGVSYADMHKERQLAKKD